MEWRTKELTIHSDMSNKIIFFTDLHLHDYKQFSEPIESGITTRMQITLDTLKAILNYAKENNIEHVFFLGDLFHARKTIKSILLTLVADILKEYADYGIELHFVTGNHDLIFNDPDAPTVYSKLNFIDSITTPTMYEVRHEQCTLNYYIAALPFRFSLSQIQEEIIYLADKVKERSEPPPYPSVLIGHFETDGAAVSDEYVLDTPLAPDTLVQNTFKYIFSGHVHKRQFLTLDDAFLWYIGTPLQNNFGNRNQPYGFLVYDNVADAPVTFVNTNDLITVPEFRKIEISTPDDIKLFLKENKKRLDIDYFNFIIKNPDLNVAPLFKKIKFFISDYSFDDLIKDIKPKDMGDESIPLFNTIENYITEFITDQKLTQELDWLDMNDLKAYMNEVTGNENVND